jgi:hypothetical protein
VKEEDTVEEDIDVDIPNVSALALHSIRSVLGAYQTVVGKSEDGITDA